MFTLRIIIISIINLIDRVSGKKRVTRYGAANLLLPLIIVIAYVGKGQGYGDLFVDFMFAAAIWSVSVVLWEHRDDQL